MTSLYDQNPAAWDKVAADGFGNLAAASRLFTRPTDMDKAIGFNYAVHHWIAGNKASRTSDERARRWLETQRKPTAQQTLPLAPVVAPVSKGALLLVACPVGTEDKARKLLAFIGCEVTDV